MNTRPFIFILLAASLLLSSALSSEATPADDLKTLKIGQPAPPFNLPGTDDQYYSLDSFSDAKLLAVIFTCNHCPTAQAYEERIKKLVMDYEARGVAVVAISPNDEKSCPSG